MSQNETTAAAQGHVAVSDDALAKFNDNYTPVPEAGCWLWTGCSVKGYGRIAILSKHNFLAHRLSWELFRGPIPPGLGVLHKCDVKCCVNPDHLFLGTQKDNVADMYAKGRQNDVWGERVATAKLTREQVLYIRSSSESRRTLGRRFGVSKQTISRAALGQCWKKL